MSPVRKAPAQLTAADAARRAEYLAEVLTILYPPIDTARTVPDARDAGHPNAAADPEATGAPGAAADPDRPGRVTEYLAIPHARRPRLLVPADSPRVAAAAVRRYPRPAARLSRLGRDLACLALRTGASAVLLRDRIPVTGPRHPDTIESHLRAVLGRELLFSVHIGPARANRKPVLQLLTPDGHTFGFAKLGINPLTRRLVRAESDALRILVALQLRHVVVPKVLYAGQWRGHELLVQEALPNARRRRSPRGVLPAAMAEVARCLGVNRGPLLGSEYMRSLFERLAEVAELPEGQTLTSAAEVLVARAGSVELDYGAWHGDWAPWNMSADGSRVLVWDWERFTSGVPLGFDAIHHELQVRLERGERAERAVGETLAVAPELLTAFGVTDLTQTRVTGLLYLIDLAARYLADRQAQAGARLGVVGDWLLPVLLNRVTEL